jgi:signal transduction histidine kinase
LLLSRLDAGRLACERRPIALQELFSDLQRQVGRLAETRGVQLAMASDGTSVQADPARLRQVLLILLDNALRHTPAGGAVRVDASAPAPARSWGERRHVCLQVSDTGVGIPAEHLPFVFERFYRVDDARGHGDGAGLGLAIAKALVEAQRGHIALESRPGTGTCVTVTLPAA